MLLPIGTLLLVVAGSRAASPAQTSASPSVAAPPAFEVSTIKLNKSGSPSSHSDLRGGNFNATNVSLKNVLQYQAYGIPGSRIFGGPKWLDSERFDIEAKAESVAAARLRTLARDQRRIQTRAMFQQLLAERFKLAVHWETRELPVYALVIGRKGPKLNHAKETDGSSGTSSGDGQFKGTAVTLAEFADALTQELSGELGRVVIDKTGIPGRFDVALQWMPGNEAPLPNDNAGGSADSRPSIFTAIQEQLGLKLESSKGPVQVLVIDHCEMPSEN
jgi:uncharacterized protein (TIGR03435 family)